MSTIGEGEKSGRRMQSGECDPDVHYKKKEKKKKLIKESS